MEKLALDILKCHMNISLLTETCILHSIVNHFKSFSQLSNV